MYRKPYILVRTREWRGDSALRACSLAARGLLVEILLLMTESPEPGRLLKKNGRPVSDAELARGRRVKTSAVKRALDELLEEQVLERDADGVLVSQRRLTHRRRTE